MNRLNESIDEFLAAVGETPTVWDGVDVRALAYRAGSEWHNLVTRIRLDARPPAQIPRIDSLPCLPNLAGVQTVLPLSHLTDFLQRLAQGSAAIGGLEMRFSQGEQDVDGVLRPGSPYTDAYCRVATPDPNGLERRDRVIAHRLTFHGGSTNDLWRSHHDVRSQLNLALRGLERPWDGLHALVRDFVGSGVRLEYGDRTTVEVVAPLEATLDVDQCRLESGGLQWAVAVDAGSLRPYISLGISGRRTDGMPYTASVPLGTSRWRRHGRIHALGRVTPTPKTLAAVTLLLRVGRFTVDELGLRDECAHLQQRPLLAVYEALDPGFDGLRQLLAPPHGQGEDAFEWAVGRLFGLLGFETIPLTGDVHRRAAVDVLAYARSEALLLAVECTTGTPGRAKGKLSQLLQRLTMIRAVLARDKAVTVLPVLATSWNREEIAYAEFIDAGESGIAVLCREDLSTLLDRTIADATLRDVAAYCRQRVTKSSSTLAPPWIRRR